MICRRAFGVGAHVGDARFSFSQGEPMTDKSLKRDPAPSAWRSVPLPNDELRGIVRGMQAYYDERAGQYDEWYNHVNMYDDPQNNLAWHAELEQLTAQVQSFGEGRLLEIASGTGWWTRHLARRAA